MTLFPTAKSLWSQPFLSALLCPIVKAAQHGTSGTVSAHLYSPTLIAKLLTRLMTQIASVPSLETAREVISKSRNSQFAPNLLPVTASIPADLLTPTLAYLKIAEK